VLLAVVAMVGIVWSLLEGPHRGWGSALIIAPAAVAILLLLVLKLQLSRLAAHEYVRPAFVSVCALAALLSIGYWATLVYLPLACSRWFGLDPASTGVLMLGATAPMLLLPRCGAPLAQRLGLGTLFACGLTAVVLGDALLWHTSAEPHLPEMLVGMLLAGSGTGLINAQLSGAFVGLAPPDWAGMASAMGITLRQLGYAVGIALLGAMEDVVAPRLAGSFAAAGFAAAIGVFIALRMRYEQHDSRRAAPA
jgi:predicted MFS family arabinose efflux permease